MTPLLDVSGLSAGAGASQSLDRVSLRVMPGEVVALIGANGAGKTTLLDAIMGFVAAESGALLFDGIALGGLPVHARARLGLGYSPEGRRVFTGLTVRETLALSFRGDDAALGPQVAEMFRLFPPLEARADIAGGQLSGGEQQMLAIARALISKPKLLLLDEPSLGLSPLLTDEVFTCIRGIAGSGAAVLLAEQNAGQALAVADRAYVLHLGRVAREGKAAELRNGAGMEELLLGSALTNR